MHIDASTTVRDLAASIPGATRIFEARRIDYCCGGARSVAEACASAGVPAEDLLHELERAAENAAEAAAPIRWEQERLVDLAKHIVERHHTYTRQELERLDELSRKVLAAHGVEHPELKAVRDLLVAMSEDLLPHLAREEVILFPYIEDLENARRAGRGRPFATVDGPIRALLVDHDHVGGLIRQLRAATNDYAAPDCACASWKALYAGLLAFEQDLHEHMHLEANVLFPRALDMQNH